VCIEHLVQVWLESVFCKSCVVNIDAIDYICKYTSTGIGNDALSLKEGSFLS